MAAVLPEVTEDHGCWTREYWLRHCVGFRVACPEGRLGFVEEVLLSPEGGEPEALAIRIGSARTRLADVPITEIGALKPEEQLVVVPLASTLREELELTDWRPRSGDSAQGGKEG